MGYDDTMFHLMRWIPLRYGLLCYRVAFEAGAASATTACDTDTP